MCEGKKEVLTWLVQTLLNVTKANVCASMADGKSLFAMARGIRMQERRSCGRKARDSMRRPGGCDGEEEARYSWVL
jgi:hypothetical protein